MDASVALPDERKFPGILELQKLAAALPLLMNKLAQQFVFQNMSRPLSFDAPPALDPLVCRVEK